MPTKKKKTAIASHNLARRKSLGERIKKLRKSKGYTNSLDFSVDKKISYSQIARWEAGRHNITFDNLCKLADALGITVSELTEGI